MDIGKIYRSKFTNAYIKLLSISLPNSYGTYNVSCLLNETEPIFRDNVITGTVEPTDWIEYKIDNLKTRSGYGINPVIRSR